MSHAIEGIKCNYMSSDFCMVAIFASVVYGRLHKMPMKHFHTFGIINWFNLYLLRTCSVYVFTVLFQNNPTETCLDHYGPNIIIASPQHPDLTNHIPPTSKPNRSDVCTLTCRPTQSPVCTLTLRPTVTNCRSILQPQDPDQSNRTPAPQHPE